MSILLDPPTLTRRMTPAKAALLCAACLVFILGAGFWAENLLSARWSSGPAGSATLIQAGLAAVLVPMTLKKMGWAGIRDVGWTSRQTRGERKKVLLYGLLSGILLSTGAGVLYLFSFPGLKTSGIGVRWVLVDALLQGFLLVVLVETVVRGCIYPTMAGIWGHWTAAVVISIGSAWSWISFVDVGTGGGGGFLTSPFHSAQSFRTFLNVLFASMILCRLMYHKGDIWAGVGLRSGVRIGLGFWVGRLQNTELGSAANGFRLLSATTLWLSMGILLVWAGVEWQNRRKMTTYGRVHF